MMCWITVESHHYGRNKLAYWGTLFRLQVLYVMITKAQMKMLEILSDDISINFQLQIQLISAVWLLVGRAGIELKVIEACIGQATFLLLV
jgi:hypothetical protein